MTEFKAIVTREKTSDSSWIYVAILLDYFLTGHGETPEIALSNLRLVIEQTVTANQEAGVAAFNGLHPAPQFYRDLPHTTKCAIKEGGQIGGYSFSLAA